MTSQFEYVHVENEDEIQHSENAEEERHSETSGFENGDILIKYEEGPTNLVPAVNVGHKVPPNKTSNALYPHKCPDCSCSFRDTFTLKHHQRKHLHEGTYKCDICNRRFKQASHLKNHRMKHCDANCKTPCVHREGPYFCKVCKKGFELDVNLKIHMRKHRDRIHDCTLCEKSFVTYSQLREHERTHTGEKPYSCLMCNSTFAKSSNLRRHERLVHLATVADTSSEKPYSCRVCKSSFSKSCNLRRHERIVHGATIPETPSSDQADLNTLSSSNDYIQSSGNLESEELTEVVNNGALEENTLTQSHSQRSPASVCQELLSSPVPDVTAVNEEPLSQPKAAGQPQYACVSCTRSFLCMSDLKDHQRKHNNERPYSCTICGKKFKQFPHLKQHKTIHERGAHTCRCCNKTFPHPADLEQHMQEHGGEEKHVCHVCKSSFSRIYSYRRHLQVHCTELNSVPAQPTIGEDGQKSYNCHLCDSVFTRVSYFYRHLQQHNEDANMDAAPGDLEPTESSGGVEPQGDLDYANTNGVLEGETDQFPESPEIVEIESPPDEAVEPMQTDYHDEGSAPRLLDEIQQLNQNGTSVSIRYPNAPEPPESDYQDQTSVITQQQILELQEAVQELKQCKMAVDANDEDVGFFNSILPHVKVLEARDKLIFRSKVQSLLMDMAYPS